MDTKRTFIAVIVMMAVVFLWQPTWLWIYKQMGYTLPQATTQPVPQTSSESATQTGGGSNQPLATSSTQSTTGVAGSQPTLNAAALSAIPATQPVVTEIGSSDPKNPTYPLALRIASEGAGLNSVVLNDQKKSVSGKEPYIYQEPYAGNEAVSRPLGTRSVTINGATLDISDVPWTLLQSSPGDALFALEINGASGPLARIVKRFELFPRKDSDQGGGFEVAVTQTIENKTDKPIEVATTFNGPTTPPQELDRGSDRSIVGGYLETAATVFVDPHFVEAFGVKQPTRDFTTSEKNSFPLLWAGTSSVYFNAIVRPEPLDPKAGLSPQYIEKVLATSLNPDAADATTHHISLTFQTKALSIAPGASIALPARVFFGPKQRSLLKTPFYAQLPRMYDATLVMTSGMCAICTFQWLITALVAMLNFFHIILFKDWGLAIIALVFVVRLILHPITKKSQVNMMKMGKMGPEIERLKKKYGDDKEGLNRAMMGFYKEQGATPVLGCLPMFLQMPIWIALWSALQSTFELRHAPFLNFFGIPFTWIHDLSQPDHLIALAHPITLFGLIPISGLNILPILLGFVFFLQQKYTPKPPATTPEQQQQQKMMQWMTLLFPLMLYGGPSGLNLYILTSTSFGIYESKVIRDHIKQREEAEKAGKVFVDAGKKFGSRGIGGATTSKTPAAPKTGLAGWIANLQDKAEQVRRDQDRPGRDKA